MSVPRTAWKLQSRATAERAPFEIGRGTEVGFGRSVKAERVVTLDLAK